MNPSANTTSISKSILSGLLAGLVAAFLGLIYTLVYRNLADFGTAEIIMPISLFIGLPVLLVMAGFAFFLLKKHLRRGVVWFNIFCVAIMIALLVITIDDTRGEGGGLLSGLRGLCLGLEVIACLIAAFLIPYFAGHPKIYE